MKKIIATLFLLIPIMTYAQTGVNVFKYKELNVKTVKHHSNYILHYQYKDGVIIENQKSALPAEMHYYYTEIGTLDSVLWFDLDKNGACIHKTSFEYNADGKQVKMQQGANLISNVTGVDTFTYNSKGLLDYHLSYRPTKEVASTTKGTNSLELTSNIKHEYDTDDRLIRKIVVKPNRTNKLKFSYNEAGQISEIKTIFGQSKINWPKRKDHSITKFSYNELGLLEKEVDQHYQLLPNGKVIKDIKFTYKRKYTYY